MSSHRKIHHLLMLNVALYLYYLENDIYKKKLSPKEILNEFSWTLVSNEQPRNTPFPIDKTEDGILRLLRDE